VLDRFKKEKVGLSVESQYDPPRSSAPRRSIKDMLAEHGHQFATIKTEVKTIPPASVQVNFNIKEGPVVKVGQIKFAGNQHIGSLELRRSMKNLKPIGIPYSIILRHLFPDLRRLQAGGRHRARAPGLSRQGLRQRRRRGAQDADSRRGRAELVHLPPQQGQAHRHPDDPSKKAARYRLGTITFTGNKRSPTQGPARHLRRQGRRLVQRHRHGKGLENLKKAYGPGLHQLRRHPQAGYDEQKKTVSMNIDIDEGKPFYVSRIEFQGNTITRDKVIRRELMLDEGSVYNSQLWEYSLLRLNQLEYFDPLKVDQDSEAHQDADAAPSICCSRSRRRARTPSA
jgi:outer membrane protein insertion porin family